MNAIADVQSSKDIRNLPINQVGIKDLRFPIRLKTSAGIHHTVARLTMTVRLSAEQKGTHMSRFVALMETQHSALDFDELKNLTQKMLELLDSDAGRIQISFPFFRQKSAPVSGIQSLLDYDVTLTGEVAEPILGKQAKVDALIDISARLGIDAHEAIAVGDGANDLGMLELAGSGVALHAKPSVAAQAKIRIDHGDLTALLYLQGYRRTDFVTP